jgi:hypothetical protein
MRKLLVFLAIGSFALSCSDETTIFENTANNVALETNDGVLAGSILFENAGVLDILEEATISGKSSSARNDRAGDHPLTLVAQVAVPSFSGGTNLTASHVDISGDYAYVSYNTADESYVGGVDIINISDPTSPRVTSRLYFTNADINAIKYHNGHIYLAGGVDAERSVTSTDNSFVARIQTSSGRMELDAGILYGFQPGYNATDVEVFGNQVYLTSGREGYLTIYNAQDLTKLEEAPFMDLRSVAVRENGIAVLDASQGVKLLDASLGTVRTIAIDSDFGLNTKRTLDFRDDTIIVAEGANGAGIYNAGTGSLEEYIPILLDPQGVDREDVVTNAVANNDGLLLMANGGAGLCLSEEKDNSTQIVGIIQLEGSVNFVASKGDYIFAASGTEGLQIIKLNRPDQSLVSRCANLSEYNGSSNLNVNDNQTLAYSGAKRLNNMNISGALLLCGSWTVRDDVNLNANGLLEMNGTLVVGRNNRRRNITVNSGATLRVEGNLTVYGDIVLNDGARIEFIGDNSVANVFGNVRRNGNVSVEGTFRDIRNKF